MKKIRCWLVWMSLGGILLGVGLIVVRARSIGDAILDLQFRIPEDPVAIFGNLLVIVSVLVFVLIWLKRD